jgi:hypothetical protein
MTEVYFYIGRLSYLIVYFNPIEEEGYIPEHQGVSLPQDPVSFLLEQSSDRRPPRIQPVYNTAKADGLTIAYDLTINFLNSSIGISSPNSTVCVGNITAIQKLGLTLYEQFNAKLYDQMGNTMKRMIQAADPIAFACYFSLFEYYKIVLDYVYTIIDVNQLVYNIFHNAGQIYDSVTSIIENVRFNDYKERGYWVNIGNNVGYIIN